MAVRVGTSSALHGKTRLTTGHPHETAATQLAAKLMAVLGKRRYSGGCANPIRRRPGSCGALCSRWLACAGTENVPNPATRQYDLSSIFMCIATVKWLIGFLKGVAAMAAVCVRWPRESRPAVERKAEVGIEPDPRASRGLSQYKELLMSERGVSPPCRGLLNQVPEFAQE